ncbi:MAG: family 43 glycosylhydrolase [Spirochaetaceae bacterium]
MKIIRSIMVISFVTIINLFTVSCISYGNRDKSEKINLNEIDWELTGDLSAHDPVVIRQKDTWYAFYTGSGMKMKSSKDGKNWSHYGQVIKKTPQWAKDLVPGSTSNIWAPDISYYNGRYNLFYSVSTFGKNRSVIGLLTNKTLDKKSPDYKWHDMGLVVGSTISDNYNCIDPNFIVDQEGETWLSFGSFWGGLKLVKLDKKSLKPKEGSSLISIASRPSSTAVEAPFIIYNNGYYYLFVSFDSCCKGVRSTYKIAVGRSFSIDGEYFDKSGKSMLNGGGTVIKKADERWKGPGHNAVYKYDNESILIYHAYDNENNGVATLRIDYINWDEEGWPYLK